MRWTLALLLAALAGCDSGSRGVLEGQQVPHFAALALDGSTLGLEQLEGKPAVLVFWASWCGPCMSEVPHVNALVRSYGDQVGFLGINMGEDPRLVQSTVQSHGLTYPVVLDLEKTLAQRFRVRSIPLVLVLDGEGRIRYRGNGLPQRPTVLLDGLLGSG